MINSGMTVREIANEMPAATRLFETLKIDYCCGGNRPLNEACASVGLKVNDVVEMLQITKVDAQPNGTTDFQKLSFTELIAHILNTHHVFTKQEMTRLEQLIQKVISAHGENHPELRN